MTDVSRRKIVHMALLGLAVARVASSCGDAPGFVGGNRGHHVTTLGTRRKKR